MASFDYSHVQQAEVLKGEDDSFQREGKYPHMNEVNVTVGQVQSPAYRDRCFGILFLLHFVVMISMAFLFATDRIEMVDQNDNEEAISSGDGQSEEEEYEFPSVTAVLSAIAFSSVFAVVLAIAVLSLLAKHSMLLIKVSLILSIAMNAFFGVMFLFTIPGVGGLLLLICALLVCYTAAVWENIPFAASSIRTAVSCVRSNLGMMVLGLLGGVGGTICWWSLFMYVFMKCSKATFMTEQVLGGEDANPNDSPNRELSSTGVAVKLGLMLSLFWTLQVIQNVVHTTVAGTVGTWWFSPMEARSFFSSGLRDSFGRAMSYSFGSICLGSLIVAIIQVIQSMLRSSARNERSNGILRCIAQCLLQYIEQLAEYFNKWAFIYVGLYGYGYVDAGKNVIELFKQRGWTNIITDQLVHRVLATMCLGIGFITMLIVTLLGYMGAQEGLGWLAMIALLVGSYLSATVFQVLSSSVDTIIVLYAEAPNEYKENHPELAAEMNKTWREAWPDNFSGSGTSHATPMQMS